MNNRFENLLPPSELESVPRTPLEERQRLLAHHVRLVTRRMSNGLCVYGSKGGLGKTKIILQTLLEELVRPLILNGHVTPLALYQNLFHSRDCLVFIDDADALYRNLPALGILRSALWGQGKSRLVTYNSSQLEIPSSFEFTGGIIFTANTLPMKNPAFNAVLSRVDVFELDATNDEVLEMMTELAREGYEGRLSRAECFEVVDFLRSFAGTRDLSLRLLEPSYQKVLYARGAGVDWRDLVRSQLDQLGSKSKSPVNEVDYLKQILHDHDSVKEQVEAWVKLTGKSRATFFRLKKRADRV